MKICLIVVHNANHLREPARAAMDIPGIVIRSNYQFSVGDWRFITCSRYYLDKVQGLVLHKVILYDTMFLTFRDFELIQSRFREVPPDVVSAFFPTELYQQVYNLVFPKKGDRLPQSSGV